MGKGQRHSKNAGVMGSESLSYAERRALGFGTVKERLGKDSLGCYSDCCLTLQPVVDPVVTPGGYLYSKEAIYENLLQQKKTIKRKLEAWEAQQQHVQQQELQHKAVEQEAKLIAFDRQNHMGVSESTANNIQSAIMKEAAEMNNPSGAKSVVAIKDNQKRIEELRAFWIPSKAADTHALIPKPDIDTRCPASGSKLRLKDLVPVKFTKVPNEDGGYMDPITKDTFTNGSKLVVLAATGDVLLKSTYEKCVKAEGRYNGVKVKEKDVIELQTGGTGFAARDGDKAQAEKHYTLGPGSGLADLRGQHQGPRSLGGLQFWN